MPERYWVHIRVLLGKSDVEGRTQTQILDRVNEKLKDPQALVLWNISKIEPDNNES